MQDFDVTSNIKAIERIKSQLLSCVADLYDNMLNTEATASQRSDILSDIIIFTYVLSARLGIPYQNLDSKALNKLKLGVLERESNLFTDLSHLYKHLENRKRTEEN